MKLFKNMRSIFVFIITGMTIANTMNAQSFQVQWKDLVGVTENNGGLDRTSSSGWNSGANSYNVLPGGKDGWIEFTVADITSIGIIGFGVSDINYNYPSVLAGWYINNGQSYYMESGLYYALDIMQVGDILRLSREGDFIKYYRNGVLKRKLLLNKNRYLTVKGLVYSGSVSAAKASFDIQLSLTSVITPVSDNGTGGAIQVIPSGGTPPYNYRWSSGETTSTISNKDIGDYSVIVTDASGHRCTGMYRPAQIIYVRKGAPSAGDGSTWDNAFPDLQLAIAAASNSSGYKQLWVAAGEYKPTSSFDRTISFIVPEKTFFFGGFIGYETSLDGRDKKINRTVLSGDLGTLFEKSDNSYHVVKALNLNSDAGLDGFIIKQGSADGDDGAGIYITKSNSDLTLKISNCEFVENSATRGGAMFVVPGGGSTIVEDCFFNGNNATTYGGGVCFTKEIGTETISFVNCSFSTNRALMYGGGLACFTLNSNAAAASKIVNCTFASNSGLINGGAIYTKGAFAASIKNSILWKNYKGEVNITSPSYNQIFSDQGTLVVQQNIIQGGYGTGTDQNIDADPLFVNEPSVIGKFPRTSIIPIANTDSRRENLLSFSGPALPGHWTYSTYRDPLYNKLYIQGLGLQVLDFSNLTNGLPTSTVYPALGFGRNQRIKNAVHEAGGKIYFATGRSGYLIVDRATGVSTSVDPLIDEPVIHVSVRVQDVIVDNKNNLLYASVLYFTNTNASFYGVLELNLVTNEKRWITKLSTPVSLPEIPTITTDLYFDGYRFELDDAANTLYFGMGNGIWWWNRSTNETGVYDTNGGMPLLPGNPNIPSNLVNSIYIDHQENKMYAGTRGGLFVWDRNNNTSKVFNVNNSSLMSDEVGEVDKSKNQNMLFISGDEGGGMFTIDLKNQQQKIFSRDIGNEIYPQLVDGEITSTNYDDSNNKLYASSDWQGGGVWIKDYNNLIPDYGDLRLQDNSPAIDRADPTTLSASITLDINGLNRFVNYPSIFGDNSLDLGAYEKTYECPLPTLDFNSEKLNGSYSFTPVLSQFEGGCNLSYDWNFGDGVTSTLANPNHIYDLHGAYTVTLKVLYNCGTCPSTVATKQNQLTVENKVCGDIYCDDNGGVGLGSSNFADGYKLSVNGKIIMEGGNIVLRSRWPDYVFDWDYKILPLLDLKKYISVNHHLPNIPQAKAMKQNGIDVGEMSVLLVEKTEELTVYLIELEERLKKLEQERLAIKE